jgi:hypothetical protein
MKTDKKLGRLRSLIHKYDSYYTSSRITEDIITRLDKKIQSHSVCKEGVGFERYNAFIEMKKLVLELKLSSDEYYKITTEERLKIYNSVTSRTTRNNAKETRDNKGVYVGSGGSNANKVRYPSKKRSKKVWNIFYKMFPYFAEKDGWDGEKSKRT